ncbi:MAG TPA: hypothetical protein VFV34_29155 [Blastocatellia bacterium]|nr:hypothetical protein [Blastocatellia bacterium]
MGITRENEERVVDRLLRAEFSRPAAPAECSGLDPDLATAYIERSLPAVEVGRYEGHLAQCTPCRTGVARLVLLAAAEQSPKTASNNVVATASPTDTWLQRLLAGLAQPKWALAATAVVALAVAIPVLMRSGRDSAVRDLYPTEAVADAPSQSKGQPSSSADFATTESASTRQQKLDRAEHGNAQAGSSSGYVSGPVSAKDADDSDNKPRDTAVADGAGQAGRAAEPEPAKRADAQPSQQPEGNRRANEIAQEKTREVAATPPAPKEEQKKISPIDETLTVSEDRSKTESRLLKPGSISDKGDSTDKERTAAIKSELAARAPQTSAESGGKGVTSRPGGRARKESEKDSPSMAASIDTVSKSKSSGQKEVGKKTFNLVDGVWTDKDYSRTKQIPGVTLIRDSDLYKEAVAKDSALKTLLDSFAASETVIVVHKRTAYKITPAKQ